MRRSKQMKLSLVRANNNNDWRTSSDNVISQYDDVWLCASIFLGELSGSELKCSALLAAFAKYYFFLMNNALNEWLIEKWMLM